MESWQLLVIPVETRFKAEGRRKRKKEVRSENRRFLLIYPYLSLFLTLFKVSYLLKLVLHYLMLIYQYFLNLVDLVFPSLYKKLKRSE